jgi:hypothetical protein
MAESSGPWDGSTFAEDEWRELFTVLPDTHIPSGDDKIGFTRSASNREITVSDGYLLVQGMMYKNTANIVIDVPSPGGGNTRIDYIVATYDPSEVVLTDRIEIELVQGSPSAGTPTAPALTQNPAGTWQMPLAVIGPYGTGVISLAPFVELGRVFTRRSFLDIGLADDPGDVEGALAAELHDEIVDQLGRTWRHTGGGTWVRTSIGSPGAGWEDVLAEPIDDSWLDVFAVPLSVLRPAFAESSTNASFTNTSPSPTSGGFGSLGVTFVCPPSGLVYVTIGGYLYQEVAGNQAVLGWQLRDGGTIGSGTVRLSPQDDNSLIIGETVDTSEPIVVGASKRTLLGGSFGYAMVVGNTYNIQAQHFVNGGQGTLEHRSVLVEPVM